WEKQKGSRGIRRGQWYRLVFQFPIREPKNTAVRSPESNGIAESFVKTIKRDYISIMPKPDGLTAAKNLAEAFEHYNEWHPHSALGYRSPREYLRQQASNGLSDNRCLEI
ncbi:integrase core domain-containing protein, partial [Salmonella enterica]|nr:integrase core domain-containing protein [Salmonella enterica]